MTYRASGAVLFLAMGLVAAACSDDTSPSGGGDASTGGSGGSSTGGKSGSGGSATGGRAGSGGSATGGKAGSAGAAGAGATGGASGSAGAGGSDGGSVPDGGTDASMPEGGSDAGGDPVLIARGAYLVNAVALCGGCHTDRTKPNDVLGGNATFRTGLPAPNLTSDDTGLGSWTDAQIKTAFTTGIDDQGKALNPTMPYQLFHNLTDADADAIVAYLRSLPHVKNDAGEKTTPVATAATPFSLSVFPETTLKEGDASDDHAAAEAGRYLLTSAAQCVRCHSPVVNGAPDLGLTKTFTGGAPNPMATPANQYAPNITPDATGIGGWSATQVVALLRTGIDDKGQPICGNMPVGPNGGYGKLTDADAHAIGVYLTTIPPVANTAADPDNEPACP
jgi:mono/diheme cytochrome c family protein